VIKASSTRVNSSIAQVLGKRHYRAVKDYQMTKQIDIHSNGCD
jgi:hypothetical protein